MSKQEIYNIITDHLKKHSASKIAVFGSYARNEESPDSDIDIIVNFSEKKNLFDLIGLQQDLEETLGKKVDLITESSIKPNRKKYIEKDMHVIFS